MPNGGLTPDCIHCKHVIGGIPNPLECGLHKIHLAIPIRAFCSRYLDPEPDDQGDWLDAKLNRSQLHDDMMYIWIEMYIRGKEEEKWHHFFEPEPLVSIEEYDTWTEEQFLEALGEMSAKKRAQYEARGYKTDYFS